MKISIIVPVYNTGIYLERCVGSLIRQTYSNVQIILINDGSTDESLEVMKYLQSQDDRILVLDRAHEGVSAARNAGLEAADGELLSFVDSDDWLDYDTYEKLIAKLIENDADAVFFEWTEEYSNGVADVKKNDGKKEVLFVDDDILITYFKNKTYLRVSSSLMKKTITQEVKFNTKLETGEDMLYAFSALCNAKKIVYINAPLYHRYNRVGSLSNRKYFFESGLGRAICTDFMVKYIEKNRISLLQLALAYSFTFYMDVLNRVMFYDAEEKQQYIYLKICTQLKVLRKKMNKPRKSLAKEVYIAYFVFRINPSIYKIIVKIYYKYIKKYDGIRQA